MIFLKLPRQHPQLTRCYALHFQCGVYAKSDEYSLSDLLERMYKNQLGLEAALMELTLQAEKQGLVELGENVRGSLWTIGENAGYIKQGLAKLRSQKS